MARQVLHGVVVTLSDANGRVLDDVRSYVGLRTVSVLRESGKPARIVLNDGARCFYCASNLGALT